MNNLVLGRYVSYDSFVHRLDPRNKILILIALMTMVFFNFSTYEVNFIMQGMMFLFVLFLMLISHIKLGSFIKSLGPIWIILIIILIINIFIPTSNKDDYGVMFNLNGFDVYWASLFQALKIAIRVILMIALTMVLTATTKPLDLTFAFEWYLTPLKVVHFPAHEIAMTLSIALRFIPTILTETEKIMKAQSSRGVDFKHGRLITKVRALISLIVPLFVSAFQRSEELADAMEARGYNPRAKRTRYHKLTWSIFDTFTLILILMLLGGVITTSVMNFTFSLTFILSIIVFIEGLFIVLVLLGSFYSLRKID